MQRVGDSTSTANGSKEFVRGQPGTGVAATLITVEWLNAVQRELVNAIEGAGLTIDPSDNTQLLKAVQALQTWAKLSGKPNTVAGFGIIDAFTKTETSTAIQQAVAALVASSPSSLDTLKELADALGSDPNFATTVTNALASKASIANIQGQQLTAFTTTGTATSFVLTPSPAISAYAVNQRFRVKFHVLGTESATLNVSGQGAKAIKQYDSTGAKIPAVIAKDQLADVEFDGVDMVVIDPLPSAIAQATETVLGGVKFASSGQVVAGASTQTAVTPAGLAASGAMSFARSYASFRDVKPLGTQGGSFTTGAWRTRDLNTVAVNGIPGASLASNQITLPAGTYYVIAQAAIGPISNARLRLFNVTTAGLTLEGVNNGSVQTGNLTNSLAHLAGTFTLVAPTVLELQLYASVSYASSGNGAAMSLGTNEVFADLTLWRLF